MTRPERGTLVERAACDHPAQLQRRFGNPHHNDDPERWYMLEECMWCGEVRQVDVTGSREAAMWELKRVVFAPFERLLVWLARQMSRTRP